jgi:prepilin-type N-terminal cleavage/methylation domain-containing protein
VRRQVGFTLLELLISLTLVSIVSLIVFMALRVSLNSYRKGQEQMQTTQREKVIVGLVKTQIGSTFPARPQGKFYEAMRQQRGETGSASPQAGLLERIASARLTIPPLFRGEERRMVFASFAPLFFRKNAGMSMISYALTPGDRGQLNFVEGEEQYRGSETYLHMSSFSDSKGTVFFEGIENGTFEYFGAPAQDGDYAWQPRWDAEAVGRLPLAVRITLSRKAGRKLSIVGLINTDALAASAPTVGNLPPNLRTIIGGGTQ